MARSGADSGIGTAIVDVYELSRRFTVLFSPITIWWEKVESQTGSQSLGLEANGGGVGKNRASGDD